MKTEQSFSYTGSDTYSLNNLENLESGISLFDKITGIGGIGYIPYDGATVLVKTGALDGLDTVQKLQPSLGNKIYYLVSDTLYTDNDKDTIISLSTEILVSLNQTTLEYEGEFVYNNPNGYEYTYLIWDYTDSLNGGTVSYSGDATTRKINISYASHVGIAGISYATKKSVPTRYTIEYGGNIVADTGYIGLNSTTNYNFLINAGVDPVDIKFVTPIDGSVNNGTGILNFNKFSADLEDALLTVYCPNDGCLWSVTQIDASLKVFYTSLSNGTLANVGTQTANVAKYHNGSGSIPVKGDTIYNESSGTTLFDGANLYHIISATSMGAPYVSGGKWIVLSDLGEVTDNGFVDCQESAVPFIVQKDIYINSGATAKLNLQASGNPTSWSLTGTCKIYDFTGGVKGSIFTITTCKGISKTITVNNNSDYSESSITTPSITFGDGTYTLRETDQSFYLPKGLSINFADGTLTGQALDSCSKAITLTATNCVGTSVSKTINITVNTSGTLTPFTIDVENFGDTGDAASALIPIYSLLYHD